jgi:hypothetical protein
MPVTDPYVRIHPEGIKLLSSSASALSAITLDCIFRIDLLIPVLRSSSSETAIWRRLIAAWCAHRELSNLPDKSVMPSNFAPTEKTFGQFSNSLSAATSQRKNAVVSDRYAAGSCGMRWLATCARICCSIGGKRSAGGRTISRTCTRGWPAHRHYCATAT